MQPTQKDLNDSIEALQKYRDRLRSEIISMSKKLRISEAKIEKALEDNQELKSIDNTLQTLIKQKEVEVN